EPFEEVYLHGLIRDKDRQKMSKSKGNVVNPLAVVDENGADALRMALVFNAASDSDLPFSEDKVVAQKRFANKIWNAARFSLANWGEGFNPEKIKPKPTVKDKWILEELKKTVVKVTKDLENYKFHEAAQEIYHFFWHEFCDKYIEDIKPRISQPISESDKKTAQLILWRVLLSSLKLLHPFMPFVTEAIYQEIPGRPKQVLMVEDWPL
ncbi:MAG: class I tRNA ligase family protein, partial [Candidatus Portnoybacteria bacterium]|nr:class I tRNA ligase family protein [Candidatus Portnoybacteria bacterium]